MLAAMTASTGPAADQPDASTIRAAVASRNRALGRLRAVTAAVGAASVLAVGGVALALPGTASAQHATTPASGSTGSGAATSGSDSSGTAASGTSAGSSGSGSSSSSGGLQSGSAPSASSGSGQVTSGGS